MTLESAPVDDSSTPWEPYEQRRRDAARAARNAVIAGILGVVLLGVVFGTMAIVYAVKADRLGRPALPGLVLGCVGLTLDAVQWTILLISVLR